MGDALLIFLMGLFLMFVGMCGIGFGGKHINERRSLVIGVLVLVAGLVLLLGGAAMAASGVKGIQESLPKKPEQRSVVHCTVQNGRPNCIIDGSP